MIVDGNHGAAENMAIDEALHRSCVDWNSPPTLRIYGWTRPAVSLGFAQKADTLDLEYCDSAGIEIVRRPTGGRAVVHGHDVTFSIVIPLDSLPIDSRSVRKSHEWLMSGVLSGFDRLGIRAELGGKDAPGGDAGAEQATRLRSQASANCFAKVAECDLRVGAFKLVGAAQMRKDGVLLQQGSIPIAQPRVDLRRLFPADDRSPNIGIPQINFSREVVTEALIAGISEALHVTLLPGSLTESEVLLAERFAREKYSDDRWNRG